MVQVFTGPNTFALQAALREVVDIYVREHGDFAIERLDGEEAAFDRIRAAIESAPFLATKKLVILRHPGQNKEFTEQAEVILSDVGDATDVLIVEAKIDKRSAYYKFLHKNKFIQEFSEYDERGLAKWLTQYAVQFGGVLSVADAEYLVRRVGIKQQLLAGEVEKLVLYAPTITKSTIDLLVEPTPQSTIFALIDAALRGNIDSALNLYADQRAQGVEPQQILAMLVWQLHVMSLVVSGKLPPDDIAKQAKISPWTVSKTKALLVHRTRSNVHTLVRELLRIDIASKTSAIDLDDALKQFIIEM